MDAAYNFACGEEAGDCIAVGINDFGAGVDMDTAHGVMDAGSDLDRIVGSLAQIHLHTGCASEIRIIFICNVFVPVAECFCKGLGIHIDLFCQIFDGFTFYSNACGNIFFRCLETFAESLVEDDICVASGLFQFCCGDNISGEELIGKSLAVLIDQDSAVAADALCDQHAGLLFNSGVELDLLDIDKVCSDFLCHYNAVTGDSGCACSDSSFQVFAVLHDHIFIVAEAAGCQDHSFGIDGVVGVIALGLDTGNSSVFGN